MIAILTFFQIDCNDDGGTNYNAAISRNLNAGTYFIRVAGYYLNSGIGTFNVVYNLNTTCANGILDNGEQCDDGNLSGGDGCSTTCTFENPGSSQGVAVNEDATPPNPSAILDIKSSSKGLLVPRVTSAQRTAISQPAKGLLVFDVTTNSFWFYTTSCAEVKENKRIAFHVLAKGNIIDLRGDSIPILDSVLYNDGNDFANNVFTVPEDGLYSFTASMDFKQGTSARPIYLLIETTTTNLFNKATIPYDHPHSETTTASVEVKLTAGTKVRVRIAFLPQNTGMDIMSVRFTGHKIY